MVVQAICVQVCRYQCLETSAPHLPCQLDSYSMTLLRRDLARLETLIRMQCDGSACFSKMLLYRSHVIPRLLRPAMEAADKMYRLTKLCLDIIFRIVQCICKSAVFCFLRVRRIVHHTLEAVLYSPYFRCCDLHFSFGKSNGFHFVFLHTLHTVEIFSPSVFQTNLNRLKKLAGRHTHLPHTAFLSDAYPLEGAVISRFFLPGTLKALTPVHRQKHTLEFYSIGTLPAGKISVVGKKLAIYFPAGIFILLPAGK